MRIRGAAQILNPRRNQHRKGFLCEKVMPASMISVMIPAKTAQDYNTSVTQLSVDDSNDFLLREANDIAYLIVH